MVSVLCTGGNVLPDTRPIEVQRMSEIRARTTHRRFLGVAIATAGLAIVAAPSALAQDDGSARAGDDQIVLTGVLLVPEGETVGTAVIFNGDATIEGTATQSVVVFNGDVEIAGTVGNDLVVFNGDVVVRSGAVVNGDIASRQRPVIEDGATVEGDLEGISGRIDLEWLESVGRIAWWVGYSVSTLLLGLVVLLFASSVDGPLAEAFRRRMGASFGFGAGIFFLLPLAAVLLLVVVVAIPLGLFLLLALALVYTVGYVAGAHVLGRRVLRPESSRFAAFLVGWGIVRGFGLIPIAGTVVWVLAAIAGLGAIVVAARGSMPVATTPVATPPVPAPPPAV
jgi:hypothetical protein